MIDILNLESVILTLIKTDLPSSLFAKYPNLKITTSDHRYTQASFPTVYIHMLPSEELGGFLSGTAINGVRATFDIEVSSNRNLLEAREIANHIIMILKQNGFSIMHLPYSQQKHSAYYSIIRARRVFGINDKSPI